MKFCYFDLETNGKSDNQIIQIGATGSRISDPHYDVYIYPDGSISKFATDNIHGIKKARRTLFRNGEELDNVMYPEDALNGFLAYLDDNFGKGAILVAHNAFGFDARILVRNLQKFFNNNIIKKYISGFSDTLEAIKRHETIKTYIPAGKRGLKHLRKSYGLESGIEHDALQDSFDLWKVVQYLRPTNSSFEWYDDFLLSSFKSIDSFL